MSKQYKIENFEDLCNIANKDNIDILAVDVAQWLITYVNAIEKIRENMPFQTKDMKNYDIAKGSFIWIDDGKNELRDIIVTVSDK